MKILVTGCAGFIGINFTEYLLGRYELDGVVGVDALTYAADTAALGELRRRWGERFAFYHADICDAAAIGEIFASERPELVVNFAAESHVDRSISDARRFVETNVLGVQVLLDACLAHGVGRFHQVSTDEVYGDLPIDSAERFTEGSALLPSSPYSASKAAADLLALSYFRTHGLSVTVSRSSNNYGRHQHTEKLIPTVISRALCDEPIPLYGDGLNERDWLHVDDHCRAVDLIMREGRTGEVYNVGGGNSVSNLSLTAEILSLLGKPSSLISFVPDRKGHDRKYALDCSKIKKELGWEPTKPFCEGLRDTVEWYKSK